MSPLTSRALRGQAPRRRYAAADVKGQASAKAVEQGQPGIEPGRTLAVPAGLLACASKHNGLLHEVWPVVRCALLVSTPLRCASRPSGSRNPRYVLRPSAPARGTSWRSCRAQYQSMCWPWLRHRHKGPQPGACARS